MKTGFTVFLLAKAMVKLELLPARPRGRYYKFKWRKMGHI
jgi:hypothetical protein